MLKLGVYKREQFFANPPETWLSYLYYRLSKSRVSLCLLEPGKWPAEAAVFERLMPLVRLSNGVYRTTFRRRFRNLDPVVNGVLAKRFSSSDTVVIQDWAASACLTSAEWAESLFPLFPRMQFEASDLILFLIAARDKQSGEVFVAEQDGRPVQYVRPPFVIRMDPAEPWLLFVNRIGYLWARSRWRKARRLWPLPNAWLEHPHCEDSLEREGYQVRKLSLIHPSALALARTDARFSISRHSIFERATAPCHVIRSMNILNRAYFSEQQLAQAARSVIQSLHSGGIWIVGRTTSEDPPVHDVTIFGKKTSGGLEAIEHIGSGSEIDSIALMADQGSNR